MSWRKSTRSSAMHLECLGDHFYELAEVDAFVGYVVEYGFVAVALVLHVSDFHVEVEVLGYFASPYHSVVLARLGFIVLVNVAGLGFAEHSFEFGALFHARFFHLQGYKLTGEGHLSYVMSGRSLYSHHVAYRQVQTYGVAEKSLAGVFELYFHQVAVGFASRHIGEPVEAMQLAPRSLTGSAAASAAFFFRSLFAL